MRELEGVLQRRRTLTVGILVSQSGSVVSLLFVEGSRHFVVDLCLPRVSIRFIDVMQHMMRKYVPLGHLGSIILILGQNLVAGQ